MKNDKLNRKPLPQAKSKHKLDKPLMYQIVDNELKKAKKINSYFIKKKDALKKRIFHHIKFITRLNLFLNKKEQKLILIYYYALKNHLIEKIKRNNEILYYFYLKCKFDLFKEIKLNYISNQYNRYLFSKQVLSSFTYLKQKTYYESKFITCEITLFTKLLIKKLQKNKNQSLNNNHLLLKYYFFSLIRQVLYKISKESKKKLFFYKIFLLKVTKTKTDKQFLYSKYYSFYLKLFKRKASQRRKVTYIDFISNSYYEDVVKRKYLMIIHDNYISSINSKDRDAILIKNYKYIKDIKYTNDIIIAFDMLRLNLIDAKLKSKVLYFSNKKIKKLIHVFIINTKHKIKSKKRSYAKIKLAEYYYDSKLSLAVLREIKLLCKISLFVKNIVSKRLTPIFFHKVNNILLRNQCLSKLNFLYKKYLFNTYE